MVENLLEFRGRLASLAEREIRQAANVGRIHRAERDAASTLKADPRLRELIRGSRSQQLDRARGIIASQRGERAQRRHIAESDRRVLRKPTVQSGGALLP